MRGWGGRQGAVMRGCGTRGQMQTDERPQIGVLCVLRSNKDPGAPGMVARYTFGVANKPEVLEVYPHKTSFRGWAYTFPEFHRLQL